MEAIALEAEALRKLETDAAAAMAMLERAVAARESVVGPDAPDLIDSLGNLAATYQHQREYAKAELLYERALRIHDQSHGNETASLASTLNNFGSLHHARGAYAEADRLYQRALSIRERVLGVEHPHVAHTLNDLAGLYQAQGRYTQADALFQRALEIRQKAHGTEHLHVAISLNNLAELRRARGMYGQAETIFTRALQIYERVAGLDHPEVATSSIGLGVTYHEQGSYAKAEQCYRRALHILENVLAVPALTLPAVLINLAVLYEMQGEVTKAEPLVERALHIYRDLHGPEHPATAVAMNHLAMVKLGFERYADAKTLLEDSRAIFERALGADHLEVASSLNGLAAVHHAQDAHDQALPLLERALQIVECALGTEHLGVAAALQNLAAHHYARGADAEAEPLYERALHIIERGPSTDHPQAVFALNGLARLAWQAGDRSRALRYFARAVDSRERHLLGALPALPGPRQRAFLDVLHAESELVVSFHAHGAPDDLSALALAFTTTLQRKGRLLAELTGAQVALRRRLSPALQAELDALQARRSELAARRSLLAHSQDSEAERALAWDIERRESALTLNSAAFRAHLEPPTLVSIQAALGADQTLVEFVRYRRFDPDKRDQPWREARYVAYLLQRQGPPRWIQLGAAEPLEDAVRAMLPALARPGDDVRPVLHDLDELVFAPIRRVVGPSDHFLLSPDAALHVVPFAALVDEAGQYLVDRLRITYLTCGRDLMRSGGAAARAKPLVLAAPDVSLCPPLPGALEEARRLREHFADIELCIGKDATKSKLVGTRGPVFLHIASHGFFRRSRAAIAQSARRWCTWRDERDIAGAESPAPPEDRRDIEDALDDVGLVLAGRDEAEAYVTAREITQVDLHGTQLVVLSACETGLGRVLQGEGIQGLRRALAIAGAETQIVSLWKVHDDATSQLMDRYYAGLRGGMGRSETLRCAQRALLHDGVHGHPFFWAAFVPIGDERPLETVATEWTGRWCGADVVILTAIQLEYEAVLEVDSGAEPGSSWERTTGPGGLPLAFRSFEARTGRPLRVAVAGTADMGGRAATIALLPLIDALKPRCIAMCGVCAGRRGKTQLGDVVVASRLIHHDAGRHLPGQVQQDLTTYQLRGDWKTELEGMDVVARFRGADWFEARPVAAEPSPSGAFQPFQLHVAPLASGSQAVADETIWAFTSPSMGDTLAIEMEGAALAEIALAQRQHQLDAVVMKGVMDFADHGRDDHLGAFAARASAECLLAFLRDHVSTELVAGIDDLLTTGTSSAPDHVPSPSALLATRYTVVPWREAGREWVLSELDAWADDTEHDVAVRLIHAAGGLGKTRLAVEWVRRRRGRREAAGFLQAGSTDDWLQRLCGLGAPVMIVIDYAESRADLVALLDRLASYANTPGPRRRIRMLLLARGDGDWWEALSKRSDAIGALLGRSAPIALSPLASTGQDRDAIFAEAARVFSAALGKPSVKRPPIALTDPRFECVLYLHMAALAAVQGDAFDAGTLMDAILDHELGFWQAEAITLSHSAVDMELAQELVAAATLRGGIPTSDDAYDLCARLARRPRSRDDDALLALLRRVYGRAGEPRYLPGLEPDLLGEAMVVRVAARHGPAAVRGAWIDRVFVAGDSESTLTTAFTVLGRVSLKATSPVRVWIASMLETEFRTRAVLALRAAKVVGQRTAYSVLGDVLAEALEQHGSASLANALDREEIPNRTVSLQRVAIWRSRTLLASADAGTEENSMARRADLYYKLGIELAAAGKREEALVAGCRAVELCRSLATLDSDAFQSALAGSLMSLGNQLSDLGRREEALPPAREAVEMYRTLAARNPDTFQPSLATSLNNLGNRLRDLGKHRDALAATHEAARLRTALLPTNPAVFEPDLAMSWMHLGLDLNNVGLRREALTVTRMAVDMFRTLAMRNPDAFQPSLAASLNNLGNRLRDLGLRKEAIEATCEAVALRRTQAARNPEAFQPALALSLTGLAIRLSELGQRDAAIETTREALAIRRALAARNPEAFRPDLAMCLHNLSVDLSNGDHEAAVEPVEEALDVIWPLFLRSPSSHEKMTGAILWQIRALHNALGRELSSAFVDRETDFARITSRRADAFNPARR